MSRLSLLLACSALALALATSGCFGSKDREDPEPEPVEDPADDDGADTTIPGAGAREDLPAASDAVGDVFVFQDAAGDAASTAEFADVNPFDYQNLWR